jgi:parafibromin
MQPSSDGMDQFRLRKSSTQSTTIEPESSPSFLIRRYNTEHSPGHSLGSSPVSPSHLSVSGLVKRASDSNNSNSTPEIQRGSLRSSGSGAGGHPLNVSDWNEKIVSDPIPAKPEPLFPRRIGPPCPPREGCEWVWFSDGYWAEREIVENKSRNRSPVRKSWFNKSTERKNDSGSSKIPGKRFTRIPSKIYNEETNSSKISSKSRTRIASTIKAQEGRSDRSSPVGSLSVGGYPVSDTSSRSRGESTIRRGMRFVSNLHPHFPTTTGEHRGWYSKTKRGFEAIRKGKLVSLERSLRHVE